MARRALRLVVIALPCLAFVVLQAFAAESETENLSVAPRACCRERARDGVGGKEFTSESESERFLCRH